MLKRFHLERKQDISGVSGCGNVADGVIFGDGQVALHWYGENSSINIYRSVTCLLNVHGHNGATEIVFDDPIDSGDKKE